MHFNLKRAAGTLALPLLGGTLWVGTAALPGSAQTFQDTALQAFNLTQPTTSTGAVVNGVASGTGMGSKLTFTAPSGEAFAASPAPHLGAGTDAALTVNATNTQLVLTSGGTMTGSATLTFTIKSTTSTVTCTAAETVAVSESGGTLSQSSASSAPNETVTVTAFNNNTTGAVEFTGTPHGAACTLTISESNLPAGLTSGNPLEPASAVPRTAASFSRWGR